MIKVLHLTAHLGGGVGKAINGLCAIPNSNISRTIVCFAPPQKTQFLNAIRAAGVQVIISPSDSELRRLVSEFDIVQLEWWPHPLTIQKLTLLRHQMLRLVVWCHNSGLSNPIIPKGLMAQAKKFIFTSECSFRVHDVQKIIALEGIKKFGVISSGGGFEGFQDFPERSYQVVNPGYIGTLNFSKLHPDYVKYLAEVSDSKFSVSMYGDVVNQDTLMRQVRALGRPELIKVKGYTNDIADTLKKINVLVYILNPYHYGTAENALLEAMASGVVPVVLNNPAESCIVKDGYSGIVVDTPKMFGAAISWLANNPEEFSKIGRQAAAHVLAKYDFSNSSKIFDNEYYQVMNQKKDAVNFEMIFGKSPAEWYLSCQNNKENYLKTGEVNLNISDQNIYSVIDETKGSLFHFSRHFSEDNLLNKWASNVSIKYLS